MVALRSPSYWRRRGGRGERRVERRQRSAVLIWPAAVSLGEVIELFWPAAPPRDRLVLWMKGFGCGPALLGRISGEPAGPFGPEAAEAPAGTPEVEAFPWADVKARIGGSVTEDGWGLIWGRSGSPLEPVGDAIAEDVRCATGSRKG